MILARRCAKMKNATWAGIRQVLRGYCRRTKKFLENNFGCQDKNTRKLMWKNMWIWSHSKKSQTHSQLKLLFFPKNLQKVACVNIFKFLSALSIRSAQKFMKNPKFNLPKNMKILTLSCFIFLVDKLPFEDSLEKN